MTVVAPEIALQSRSSRLRGRYIQAAEDAARDITGAFDGLLVLDRCVAWLELFNISTLVWEFIHYREVRSLDELRLRRAELETYIKSAFPGADAAEHQIRRVIADDLKGQEVMPEIPSAEWSQIVRSFDAVVAECPIDGIESLGLKIDKPELAYRARTAYDALRAFVHRHDAGRAEVVRIVGEQYRGGHITLSDAARLLDLTTSDAVFDLEQNGYCRPISAFLLDDARREAVYARLRTQRFRSSGPRTLNKELVERDVVASERIEGVDARAWIRRR